MSKLVIVESPTKAKTIAKFLGSKYVVKSSFGHIRDLPKTELGIDVEHDFTPRYVIPTDKKKVVTELKKAAKKTDEILFATDGDREGEAIAWHLANIFNIEPKDVKRLVFHEITAEAIQEAVKNPRPLYLHLVDAQQARRILDRLVGYKLSPLLWKKIARGLSAGRVQSVALRLIIEREREIQKFNIEEYWSLDALFNKNDQDFTARLYKVSDKILGKMAITTKDDAEKIFNELAGAKYQIVSLEKKTLKKTAPAPFTTSTLQQEANRRLGFSAKQTMLLAQQLYEGINIGHETVGLITYMRTDSVNLAEKFISEAREIIGQNYGAEFLPKIAKRFTTKSKLAQEAHEAIRPTAAVRDPESLKDKLDPRQGRLYDLIWKRALACQMTDAKMEATAADIANDDKKYIFRATGNSIVFAGFLKIYSDIQKENLLPALIEGEKIKLSKLEPAQHFTEPPARYNDASLIKILEEYGIGRPSTYAPTISTLIARKYVDREERKRLQPTEIAFLVNDLLVQHFPQIVDYQFTAKMEGDLDNVAEGKESWIKVIKDFYGPFDENLQKKYAELNKKDLTEEKTDEVCEKCGSPMIIKIGRFGKFLACSKYPDCKNTKNLNKQGVVEEQAPIDEKCELCGAPLQRRHGRFGEFLSCSKYPECKYIKKQVKLTGVKCPQCLEGDIIEKRTRKGKPFFACSRYPDCKFALWNRPTGDKCPDCQSLMVWTGQDKTACSNKECSGKEKK